ncbi:MULTISPECIES: hypothetical protein [Corynebacterium]|uniref:Uncharacterized protein n=3 Tax=Corynebacterium TaxID=1716 RepID=A0ABD4TP37_9CORY|nr:MULTISPECIES: hypothetical protein [Corynebacterium]MCO6394150.1 hypothetical protein [Corynebacterium lipophilum]MCQ4607189.1 hypothetical protein [Corynebacterium pseudogenitalium]MCQ4609333.1 hypothetical protein [Corynebacterium sp. CCUG 61414]MCQ4612099.1 hypothetical protein [Corynebacterium sp. CCUG 51687]MCQ4613652.1 hypothetical protein [Corynebacterium pseudogenitalium]
MMTTAHAAIINTSAYLVAQAPKENPVGPDFGKASPFGLLLLVMLAVVILSLGFAFHRRYSRFRRRSLFAEKHGIDPFDQEALDKAMAEAGVLDRRKKRWI